MNNDFITLASSRFSVRKFSDKKVEREKVDLILNAGQVAPTACNNQPQKIYVLKARRRWKSLISVNIPVLAKHWRLLFAMIPHSAGKGNLTAKPAVILMRP